MSKRKVYKTVVVVRMLYPQGDVDQRVFKSSYGPRRALRDCLERLYDRKTLTWTDTEDDYIAKNYRTLGPTTVARYLARKTKQNITKSAVISRWHNVVKKGTINDTSRRHRADPAERAGHR